ncbi:MAG: hypothetical protein GWP91_05825 [Rhodobacterales bacterium]|nr:hypothetical protein [Rhodobacterales bacterium]
MLKALKTPLSVLVAAVAGLAISCAPPEPEPVIHKNLDVLLPQLVAAPTVRSGAFNVPANLALLGEVKSLLDANISAFNKANEGEPITSFEWRETINGIEYWLFGFRVGSGPQKIAFINHTDVAAADEADGWSPFEVIAEDRDDLGTSQPFLVGRGRSTTRARWSSR